MRRYLVLCLLICGLAVAQSPEESILEDRKIEITPAMQTAIDRGLAYLAERQVTTGPLAGTWPSFEGRNAGVCAFAAMAFLAAGNLPQGGAYSSEVNRTIDYVISCTGPDGLISRDSATIKPMYEHAMGTVLLAEVYGMAENPGIRDKLKSAVSLIVNTQNRRGGWRYQPRIADADISVTVMQLLALRAAQNVGISVPQQTIDRAIQYVEACAAPTGSGGFLYQPGDRQGSSFGRTAAGTFSLLVTGNYESDLVRGGIEYLKSHVEADDPYFFYGRYYAAMSMYQFEDQAGWNRWFPIIRDQLLEMQDPHTGLWHSHVAGDIYGTSMALLVLTVPYRILPIYQR
jgi:hypothetical protein